LLQREHEILVFLGVIIFWKNRKATNYLHYLSNVFLFSKLANSFLFLRADPLIGTIYVVIAIGKCPPLLSVTVCVCNSGSFSCYLLISPAGLQWTGEGHLFPRQRVARSFPSYFSP
jgi:hypothetical protein